MSEMMLFTGTGNPALSEKIAERLGKNLGSIQIQRFSDGEIHVMVEESVRGDDVFIVQSMPTPVNEHLMELLIMIDACRRASARQITAIVPYFG